MLLERYRCIGLNVTVIAKIPRDFVNFCVRHSLEKSECIELNSLGALPGCASLVPSAHAAELAKQGVDWGMVSVELDRVGPFGFDQ